MRRKMRWPRESFHERTRKVVNTTQERQPLQAVTLVTSRLRHVLNPTDTAAPRPLVVASVATLVEALCFVVLAAIQAASFSSERSAMGWTTIAFFVLWALMLAGCGLALLRSRSWARSPIVLAQLIQLGVAWSFVKGEPAQWEAVTAWTIAAVALVVLVGLLHPKSIAHLAATDA